jgi:cell division septation protein DedD
VNRAALVITLLLATGCARNGQPGFEPMPEARRGQIELDPQEATKKLAEAMTAAGLPVTEVATREGFVATAWYDTATMKSAGARPLGPGDVRIRGWVMPWKYGWSEITMEAVYRPVADPSLPARELERSVPYGHPARVKIREVMQQMGVTSTLAEADAPEQELKRPIMDPGRVGKTGAKLGAAADTVSKPAADTSRPDSVPARRDSAMVFRPRTPGDTIHQRVPVVTPARPVAPDTAQPVAPPVTQQATPTVSPPAVPPAARPSSGYAVQVAATPDSSVAGEFARRLRSLGYEARIVTEDGRYKARTQLYADRTDAAIALERLRATFRDAFMVRE